MDIISPMADQEAQEVAKLIRDGSYFREARSWYQAVYIHQISERAFFLLIALLAALIALFGVLAMMDLLPITDHQTVLIRNREINKKALYIIHMREHQQPLNPALLNFFITAYVQEREGYKASEAPSAKAFVSAHSDPITQAAYLHDLSVENLAKLLGEGGERRIEVNAITINSKIEPPVATVIYTAYDTAGEQSAHAKWQVSLGFYYTPLVVKEVVDKDSGQTIIQTEEPQFQVVQYEHQPLK